MRRSLLSLIILSCLTSTLYAQNADSSALTPGPDEQSAIDQLRAIVESIKTCQLPSLPPLFDAEMEAEGFADVHEPPASVVWNVELHPSIRARYVGSIEFSEASYIQLPPNDSYCNKPKMNKSECRRNWAIGMGIYQRQVEHPLRFRYEFDVTTHGLEFLQSFTKTKQIDGEQWVDGTIKSDWCAFHAISTVPHSTTKEKP